MGKKYDFKYLVIGSGPAGSAAALTLAKAKKKVGLIEGGPFGGANLNTRDVPYAVTLNFAHTYYQAMHLPEFGYQDFSVSFPSIRAQQMKAIIESGGGTSAQAYESTGLICIKGYATFLDSHTVSVGGRKFSSEYFILATGSALDTVSLAGVDTVNFLTPETALQIYRLPEAVLIIGGGSTGCEIAEFYATLGAKTILLEKSPRLLPREEKEASEIITNHLTDDLNVMVLTGATASTLSEDEISKFVVFQDTSGEKMIRTDSIVLATGSKPQPNFGLDHTGVKLRPDGFIKVNQYFETAAKNIYAIGDCIGSESSTERADYEGRLLANNFINKTKSTPNYKGLARITNTSPAVATFFPLEADLRKHAKHRVRKAIINFRDIPAGKIYHYRAGYLKLLADHTGHVVGGTIVGPAAADLAGELSLAIRHRISVLELASTPHPINHSSYALQLAAKKLVR